MAKIICITSGLTGILNASFELVGRLVASGHEVLYAAPRNVGDQVSIQGIPFQQLPEIKRYIDVNIQDAQGVFGKIKRLIYKIKNVKRRQKEARDQIYPSEFEALIEKEQPDLLLIDIELHEYVIKGFSMKVPLLLLSQWFSIWKRPGLPYLLRNTIPGEDWRGGRLLLHLDWWLIGLQRKFIFAKRKLYAFKTNRRSILLDLAKSTGFPLAYIKENYWPGPFLYDQLPVISMTARELEFPHKLRENLVYVGPMVNEERGEIGLDEVETRQIADLIALKRKSNKQLIYCSVSTLSKGDVEFLIKVIKAVKDQKQWLLVIGLGRLVERRDLGNLPENVFAYDYVPQLKILEEADCSINHGGIHTINECIHFRVPMLIYSGKQSDQNGCAARIHFHGLGIMADKDKDSIANISANIREVLTNETYRRKMDVMYSAYQKYKSNNLLEQTINSLFVQDIFKKKKHNI